MITPVARTLVGAAFGAAAMFWLDPATGRRRRAFLRDRLESTAAGLGHAIGIAGRDLSHRVQGVDARMRSVVTPDEATDKVLAERVRSALGRVVSHPGAIEAVFEVLSRYENFPSFMRNVRNVQRGPEGRSHWVVAGPAGVSVEWDAETTAYEPNELLAWRTVANTAVTHAGLIRFERARDGTRLHIELSYTPPAGALGHVVAKLFGADPKTELDEDLIRLKTFVETGVPARDAARAREPGVSSMGSSRRPASA